MVTGTQTTREYKEQPTKADKFGDTVSDWKIGHYIKWTISIS
jgi:hypothetical protein